MDVTASIEALMARLDKELSTKTVIGEPIGIEGVTLIPVVDITFGVGAGGGTGQDKEHNGGEGGGAGGGARNSAKAAIVIKRDGAVGTLLLSKAGGTLERLIESAPGLIEKIAALRKEKAPEKEPVAT